MFSINSKIKKGFELIQLTNRAENVSVEIIPTCGGLLHSFSMKNYDEQLNIIDSYESKEEFLNYCEAKGFKSCKLSPFPCRINNATFTFEEKQYHLSKFILHGAALHGMLYNAIYKIIDTQCTNDQTSVQLETIYENSDEGFPFKYSCSITYCLMNNATLNIKTAIKNLSTSNMPIADGWHPYFKLGKAIDDLELKINANTHLIFDEALIPTGETEQSNFFKELSLIRNQKMDDCFTGFAKENEPVCILRNSEKKIQIEIFANEHYPYLQIYTPDHRQSIAIENLSAAPDAFNNGMGLKILAPNESVQFTCSYKISHG